MGDALKKLKKLRGRSADELRVRAAQAAAAYAERRGWSREAREPSDREFFALLDPAGGGSDGGGLASPTAESLLAHFRARTAPRFFAAFDDSQATRLALRERFAGQSDAVERARRVAEGRFRLLGFDDLTFGDPVDWHLEPVAGRRAPLVHWSRINYLDPRVAGDKKITWELNRHQHFQTLGRAYWLTGDELFAETFAAHLSSWMDANPPKLGINWASSLEVAFRSMAWLWALHLFKDSPRLTPALYLRALKFLHLHARHLETYLSTYFSPNTHLTGEALGLFHLGALLPELRRAARWRDLGASILVAELGRQVRPDGTYFEQTTYYQRYTADFYTHFLLLARANRYALDPRVERGLVAMAEYLMCVTRPDGRAPLFGDDDGGRLALLDDSERDDFRPVLSTAAALFARPDFKFVAGRASEETLWLAGAEGLAAFDQLGACPPSEGSRAFPDGGFYVMRDGWSPDSNFLMLDCGPHGADNCGHAHADALSFELSARGRAAVVDPGTYTYSGDAAARDEFRSSPAHNALSVDGESSSAPAGPFSWASIARARTKTWTTHPRFDYFEGGHGGYARLSPAAEVSRAVLFLKGDYFIIRDRVTAPRGARHACALHFHLAPGAAPTIEDACALRVRAGGGGESLLDLFAFGREGRWRERQGWVSRCYGAREAARVVAYEAETVGAAEFHTFLVPRAASPAAKPSVRRLDATGGHLFEISAGGGQTTYDVLLAASGSYAESGRFASDFEWSWARFAGEGELPEELVLVNGRRFSLYGREIVRLAGRAPFVVARREGDRLVLETNSERRTVELGELTAISY